MISQNERPGAQILQFPPPDMRERRAAQRQAKWKLKSADLQITPVVVGGAWYHDAAIADSDRTRNS